MDNQHIIFKPQRGDMISYAGRHLYYQPNGKSCYLYGKKSHIGCISLALYTPANKLVGPVHMVTDPLPNPKPQPPFGPPSPEEIQERLKKLNLSYFDDNLEKSYGDEEPEDSDEEPEDSDEEQEDSDEEPEDRYE